MALHSLGAAAPAPPTLRLREGAVAVPALSSHLRPALVLADRDRAALLAAAAQQDVARGGVFWAGPAGIQVWDRPFDGPGGTRGSARHLGSIDWSHDTPSPGYLTLFRAILTQAGVDAGVGVAAILARVLALGGVTAGATGMSVPAPLPRDPFRRPA